MERKFWYDFDIESKLVEIGAKKLENNFKKIIIDDYFDNFESHFMLLNDYLLRSRTKNNRTDWQLKYPSKLSSSLKNVENYFEIAETQQIIDLIFEISKKDPLFDSKLKYQKNCKTIESLVDLFNFKSYARINSTRKSYFIDNIRIDLDETDFNYKLGEIELILDDKTEDNIKKSIDKISCLTSKLGITKFDRIPGKISTYLFLFNRELFEMLRKNLVINDQVDLNLKHLFKKI